MCKLGNKYKTRGSTSGYRVWHLPQVKDGPDCLPKRREVAWMQGHGLYYSLLKRINCVEGNISVHTHGEGKLIH